MPVGAQFSPTADIPDGVGNRNGEGHGGDRRGDAQQRPQRYAAERRMGNPHPDERQAPQDHKKGNNRQNYAQHDSGQEGILHESQLEYVKSHFFASESRKHSRDQQHTFNAREYFSLDLRREANSGSPDNEFLCSGAHIGR